MGKVAIIGSGLAGLASALFLARRGHHVTVLEKDTDDLSTSTEGIWLRQGVGHAGQTHAFLALSTKVMREEAPDVITALEESGSYRRPNPELSNALDPDPAQALYERRLGYERVLRAKALAEPNIDLRLGRRVTGFLTEPGKVPHVVGVRTEGEDIAADFAVDAGGRRSQTPKWLTEMGARPLVETSQACGFHYMTRWFRLRDGETHPDGLIPITGRTHFGAFILAPAGARHFSVALTFSEHEPFRHILRQAEVFDWFAGSIPALAPWVARAEGVGEPQPFGGIENRRRRLVDEEGSIVSGMVLVGDAAMHTNPTLGRGVSLAFSHAQHLAQTIDDAFADPLGYVAAFERWTDENHGEWFDSQVAVDAELAARFNALARDEPEPEPSQNMRFGVYMGLLSQRDAVVASAFFRMQHMLTRPSELRADMEIGRRVAAFMQETPELPDLRQGPTRAEVAAWTAA